MDVEQQGRFKTGVGTLLYLAPDRVDIQASVRFLTTRVTKIRHSDVKEMTHLIQYLKGTSEYCLYLHFLIFAVQLHDGPHTQAACEGSDKIKLATLTDADYVGSADRKSVSVQIFLAGNMIKCMARFQKNIALSTFHSKLNSPRLSQARRRCSSWALTLVRPGNDLACQGFEI